MAKISVLSLAGEKVKDLTLNDTVWNTKVNEAVVKDAIRLASNSLRQGTAKTKDKSEVSGGGRKPWKQKGTGRARQGSTRNPHWVGGGIAFGPTPRSYSFKMNKKERRLALRSALSDKFLNKDLIVVDTLMIDSVKTKDFNSTLNTIKAVGKTLIVTTLEDNNLCLATRNNKLVSTVEPSNINVLEIVKADKLVIDEASVKTIEEVLK